MSGTLYLVGTGPGDPELITLKAARILAGVPAVAYPRKPGENSMALGIAAQHLAPGVEHLSADVEMSRDRTAANRAYDGLAETIRERVGQGRSVAYLCEGDPLFYGSAIYLLERLGDDVPVEIVPGVPAPNASAAVARVPLVSGNQMLKILPAPLDDDALLAECEGPGALAILKLGRHFDRIKLLLERTGRAEAALIVEHATGAGQRIVPLAEFGTRRPYFATLLSPAREAAQ